MKSPLGCRTSVVLALLAAAIWPRTSQGQEPPNQAGPVAPAPTPPAVGPKEAAPATMAAPPASMENKPAMPPAGTTVRWYENFKYEAFVDTYFSMNYNFPRPQYPGGILGSLTAGPAGSLAGGNQFRAYDQQNGFALHWFGLDITHAPDPIGGGFNLRLGPGAALFNAATFGGTDSANGLQYVKNAYVNWKPGGKDSSVTLTIGKFNQPFGSEVPESQYNMNYSRSMLYWFAQPLFLTGLKLDWAATDQLTLSAFLVNGWNNSLDNNIGKSWAAQVSYMPSPQFMAVLGYIGGPEQADVAAATPPATGLVDVTDAGSRLRHFVDLILDIKPTKELRFLINADYGVEKAPPGTAMADGTAVDSWKWYGVNLGVGYAVTDIFSLGIRGEYYKDPQGFTTLTNRDTSVVNGTLTLAASPTPNLIIKLDNRLDSANEPFFQKSLNDTTKTQFTTTLGVVGTTGM